VDAESTKGGISHADFGFLSWVLVFGVSIHMTLLYSDPRFQEHITGAHPENPRRLVAVEKLLDESGLRGRCTQPQWQPATFEQLALTHDPGYIEQVNQFAAAGGGRIEVDTVLSERSCDVAVLAVGAVCDAVRRVVAGEDQTALCLTRPPGHHARPRGAMGFCLFDNVAIGAKAAIDRHQLDRVLIVDWDVHHGNGTQEIFWNDGRVGFLSIHRWPFYPGTGDSDETGSGRGLGMISNVPVEFGTPLDEYHDRFERALGEMAAKVRPQLVMISAGFDAHRQDPIGSLGLEVEDFVRLTRTVLAVAREHADGRVVSVLEGGYNPQRLAESVGVHLEALLAAASSQPVK
jgi:acetoin utilization deacetylase AcuC-like enzyme